MTPIPQHKGVLKIDVTDGATALTDISSGITSVTLNDQSNSAQFHTIGNAAPKATVGGYMHSADVEALVETGTTTSYAYLHGWKQAGTERSVEIYTPDVSTGSILLSGEFICVDASPLAPISGGDGNPQKAKFRLLGAGALSRAAAA